MIIERINAITHPANAITKLVLLNPALDMMISATGNLTGGGNRVHKYRRCLIYSSI
jgi:hypothetical protein